MRYIYIPYLLCASLDTFFTLHGQSDTYWRGSYWAYNEDNLIGAILLRTSPWLFLLTNFVYWALAYILLKKCPFRVANVVACCLSVGHIIGIYSWNPTHNGVRLCMILASILGIGMTCFMEKNSANASIHEPHKPQDV